MVQAPQKRAQCPQFQLRVETTTRGQTAFAMTGGRSIATGGRVGGDIGIDMQAMQRRSVRRLWTQRVRTGALVRLVDMDDMLSACFDTGDDGT